MHGAADQAGSRAVERRSSKAALFLALPRSTYVDGDEMIVDGGFNRNVMGLIPRAGYDRAEGGLSGVKGEPAVLVFRAHAFDMLMERGIDLARLAVA